MSTLSVNQVNTAIGSVIASQTTLPDTFWASGQLVPISGTANITGIAAAPTAGLYRTILAEGAFTLTDNGSTFRVFGGTQTVSVGDLIDVYALTTSTFYCRINGIGKKEVDSSKASSLNSATATGLLALAAGVNTTVTGLKAALAGDADTVSGYGIGVTFSAAIANIDTTMAQDKIGFYRFTSVSTAGTLPHSSTCRGIVAEIPVIGDTNNCLQIAWSFDEGGMYRRSKINGTWYEWTPFWSPFTDGNGGRPPAPKPSTAVSDAQGMILTGSVASGQVHYYAGSASKTGTWCLMAMERINSTGIIDVTNYSPTWLIGSGTSGFRSVTTGNTLYYTAWRIS